MVFRMFMVLIGFGFSVAGGVSIIGYLNLLAMGYTFADFFLFVIKRPECYLLPIGILIMTFASFVPHKNTTGRE